MPERESKTSKTVNRVTEITGDLAKGTKIGTRNYSIRVPTRGNNVVNIIDQTAGSIRQSTGRPAGDWLIRFDRPHRGATFEHININPELNGLAHDPHIPISASTLETAKTTANTLKKVNKVLLPAAVIADTARVGYSVYKDVKQDTTRNTVKTASSVAGGWGGGYGGAMAGAAAGSCVCPGIGTIVGGVVGGIAGGIGGALGAEYAVDAIGDEVEWDIETYRCKRCERKFKCRKYQGESRRYCPDCR